MSEVKDAAISDIFTVMARASHPSPRKSGTQKFWIHCPACSGTKNQCDFIPENYYDANELLRAVYNHCDIIHPYGWLVVVEFSEAPAEVEPPSDSVVEEFK